MGQVRTTRPGAGDKYYITRSAGGYSTCIVGKPTDRYCNVLSNCVGYACGALNEEDAYGYEKYHLNCNAENFIERAIASGLSVYNAPKVGDIMVWQRGSLSGSDGAGHVAICIYNNGHTIKYAQSGYGSSNPFWITTTTNSNGRYGLSSSYTYRGAIRPSRFVQDSPKPQPAPEPPKPTPSDKFNIGDEVILNGPIYVSSDASNPANIISNRRTNITRKNPGSAHPYNTTGDLGWCDESSLTKVTPIPTPQPTGLQVGDRVRITGYGNGASDGSANTAGGIGWEREILKIYEGRKFPYQVGNSTGTTGFYPASSLQKL